MSTPHQIDGRSMRHEAGDFHVLVQASEPSSEFWIELTDETNSDHPPECFALCEGESQTIRKVILRLGRSDNGADMGNYEMAAIQGRGRAGKVTRIEAICDGSKLGRRNPKGFAGVVGQRTGNHDCPITFLKHRALLVQLARVIKFSELAECLVVCSPYIAEVSYPRQPEAGMQPLRNKMDRTGRRSCKHHVAGLLTKKLDARAFCRSDP